MSTEEKCNYFMLFILQEATKFGVVPECKVLMYNSCCVSTDHVIMQIEITKINQLNGKTFAGG